MVPLSDVMFPPQGTDGGEEMQFLCSFSISTVCTEQIRKLAANQGRTVTVLKYPTFLYFTS